MEQVAETAKKIPAPVFTVAMGIIIFLMVFLCVRMLLQIFFLKECPNCGRTVSLLQGRECSRCGYYFLRSPYTRVNTIIAALIAGIALMGYLDYQVFHQKTSAYVEANGYIQEMEQVDSTETEQVTEEGQAETETMVSIETEIPAENAEE